MYCWLTNGLATIGREAKAYLVAASFAAVAAFEAASAAALAASAAAAPASLAASLAVSAALLAALAAAAPASLAASAAAAPASLAASAALAAALPAALAASLAASAAALAASLAASTAGAGAGAGASTGAGAGAGAAASSFLPQAARATAAINDARTTDFFIWIFLTTVDSCVSSQKQTIHPGREYATHIVFNARDSISNYREYPDFVCKPVSPMLLPCRNKLSKPTDLD